MRKRASALLVMLVGLAVSILLAAWSGDGEGIP